MKTELLITGAIMLTAMAIPLTCTTSPSLMEASAAQEAIVSSVDSLKTETMDTIDKGIELVGDMVLPSEEQTDCDVWHQDFLNLHLPDCAFDGIFANASTFHIPTQELHRVLRQLYACLKPDGVLFCSNPRGPDIERFTGGRYGAFLEWQTWRAYLLGAGFFELEHYYRPQGRPRAEQPWLATLWRRPAFSGSPSREPSWRPNPG